MNRERGVVATEAILSFALLLTTLLLFWSAVRLVYEKTSLETATQLSAQAGVTYFLRNTPISCSENELAVPRCDEGRMGAERLANAVFESNICDSDRSLGRETGDPLSCFVDEPNKSIKCRLIPQSGVGNDPFTTEACQLDEGEKASAKALIVMFEVEGEAPVDGGLLATLLPSGVFVSKSESYGWRRLN